MRSHRHSVNLIKSCFVDRPKSPWQGSSLSGHCLRITPAEHSLMSCTGLASTVHWLTTQDSNRLLAGARLQSKSQ